MSSLHYGSSFTIYQLILSCLTKSYSFSLKGPCHRNKFFLYMKEIPFLKIIHKEKISFSPPFSFKIADLAENVRLEEPEKQAKVY